MRSLRPALMLGKGKNVKGYEQAGCALRVLRQDAGSGAAHLIAGPGVYICNECVELCHEIISDSMEEATAPAGDDRI